MTKEELLDILKDHFPTKEEHRDLKSEISEISSSLTVIDEKIDDLRASSNAFDKMLEAQPIPRIERLERHSGLPSFASSHAEE